MLHNKYFSPILLSSLLSCTILYILPIELYITTNSLSQISYCELATNENKYKKNKFFIKFYFRFTLNNIDLNRDFPDYLGVQLSSSIRALETRAIMSWLHQVPFVLSANFHGGAFIINIPYDRYCKNLIYSNIKK